MSKYNILSLAIFLCVCSFLNSQEISDVEIDSVTFSKSVSKDSIDVDLSTIDEYKQFRFKSKERKKM